MKGLSAMSTSYKVFFSRIAVILSFFAVSALSVSSYAQSLNLKNNTVKVCSDAGFLPFEMKNNQGQWEGFDVDMMNSFAQSLNAKLQMVQINFDGIIPALLSGKCDMIAAGMTVTPSRQKVVAFSHPTFVNGLSIAFRNTDEAKTKYTSLTSLDKIGVKIAVKTGYTSDIYLTKNLKNAQILRFDQDTDLYLAVMQNRADAFVSDSTYVSLIAKDNANKLIVLPTKLTAEEFSVATRMQDKELVQAFNQFLEKWKSSTDYRKVYEKYFQPSAKVGEL